MNLDEKILKYLGIDFADWYQKIFQIDPEQMEKIRRMKKKPLAYRKLQEFLEPVVERAEKDILFLQGHLRKCPLVPNLTMMSMGARSNLLGEHSIQLDEWYQELKRFVHERGGLT